MSEGDNSPVKSSVDLNKYERQKRSSTKPKSTNRQAWDKHNMQELRSNIIMVHDLMHLTLATFRSINIVLKHLL
jgi:hypothetical protein